MNRINITSLSVLFSHSVMSDSLRSHGVYRPWNSPGKNTGVGSHPISQGIFSTQGLNPGLPHCRWIPYHLRHRKALEGLQFSSVAQSCLTLRSHELQQARPPCPSLTPEVYPYSCPLSRWCHQTISSSVVTFSPCLRSFPASGSFQMSQLFASGGQSTGVSASASVFPMNIQD